AAAETKPSILPTGSRPVLFRHVQECSPQFRRATLRTSPERSLPLRWNGGSVFPLRRMAESSPLFVHLTLPRSHCFRSPGCKGWQAEGLGRFSGRLHGGRRRGRARIGLL